CARHLRRARVYRLGFMTVRITIAFLALAIAVAASAGEVRGDPSPGVHRDGAGNSTTAAARDVAAGATPPAPRQPSAAPSAAGARVEDAEKTLGPFSLAGRDYTVVSHTKHLAGTTQSDSDREALAALDVRDPSGTVVHHETFE